MYPALMPDLGPWIAIEVLAVGALLLAVAKGHTTMQWIAKPAASAVFVALGFVRADFRSSFDLLLIGGLTLGMAGDILLIDRRTFRAGLLTFLAGHGAYIAAFWTIVKPTGWMIAPLAILLPAALLSVWWLRPHAGSMFGAVLAYIAVISVMAWGGVALALRHLLPSITGVAVVLFFLSDLAVARHRFVRAAFVNRLFGLPAYYAAQILLALTVGWNAG